MLQKIEEINLSKLMKDIKNMISEDKLELKNEDYEIRISKSDNVTDLGPLIKLLNLMVKEEYLVTELYFENDTDFEKCFNIKYEDRLSEIFHSIRIEEIRCEDEDSYNGTFIYHEAYGGKLKFELACIKYLSKFQRQIIWDLN
ncbi:hypothetical protein [Clostridium sp. 1001271B_151109_B4]|uniref:hypothetical protein n=1 Tax=Clostridium sp. 1001271B_151109_B4 TaxID=2787148 RepID=UPI0018A993A2|nr:hypothetical protein [Clostridium sp. 1001271B_151109_B4]